jgi:hypothetical protein
MGPSLGRAPEEQEMSPTGRARKCPPFPLVPRLGRDMGDRYPRPLRQLRLGTNAVCRLEACNTFRRPQRVP